MEESLKALLDKVKSASKSGVDSAFVEELKALAADVEKHLSDEESDK